MIVGGRSDWNDPVLLYSQLILVLLGSLKSLIARSDLAGVEVFQRLGGVAVKAAFVD